MSEYRYTVEVTASSVSPLAFDSSRCIGCCRCVEACQIDVLLPPQRKGGVPRVVWPGECWYCGACVMECPQKGAIRLRHPLMNQARFVERASLRDEAPGKLP